MINIKHGFGGGNGTWCVTSVDLLDFGYFRMRSLVKNLGTFEVSGLLMLKLMFVQDTMEIACSIALEICMNFVF